jgi:hypothetical protein
LKYEAYYNDPTRPYNPGPGNHSGRPRLRTIPAGHCHHPGHLDANDNQYPAANHHANRHTIPNGHRPGPGHENANPNNAAHSHRNHSPGNQHQHPDSDGHEYGDGNDTADSANLDKYAGDDSDAGG